MRRAAPATAVAATEKLFMLRKGRGMKLNRNLDLQNGVKGVDRTEGEKNVVPQARL
jgi:hypothetical protein